MNFSEKIKTQRKKLGLTQSDIAKKLFVTRQTVSSWENGKSYPDLNMLVKISDVYEVPVDALLKGDTELTEYLNRKKARWAFDFYGDIVGILFGFYNFDQYWMYQRYHVEDNSIWSLLFSMLMLGLTVHQILNVPLLHGSSRALTINEGVFAFSLKNICVANPKVVLVLHVA